MDFEGEVEARRSAFAELANACGGEVEAAVAAILKAVRAQRPVLFMGNGGSAADAQHLAAEFVGRFVRARRALPALAIGADGAVMTALANDFGYHQTFSRQVEAFVKPDDVVVGLSTSGQSANVVDGMRTARALGAVVIGLTGRSGGVMHPVSDILIQVPSDVTAIIQEMHAFIGHYICQCVDEAL